MACREYVGLIESNNGPGIANSRFSFDRPLTMKPGYPDKTTDREAEFAELADEIIERLQQGESFDLEWLADEHPEHAESLRAIWPSLQWMRNLNQPVSTQAPAPFEIRGEPDTENRLGDFRIIREIGRGGMGVVYEAEQQSMGRNVALKVLPFAAVANANALQRFKNEVRSAATLDHANIVSVYSIGEERGIHYFAMQLIAGQTLAALIGQLRDRRLKKERFDGSSLEQMLVHCDTSQPVANASQGTDVAAENETFPEADRGTYDSLARHEYYLSIAQLAIQAARGLQHAHQRGVIHRDIKPANLMVDADRHLYIADFGLARIESDAGMTMTGDLIGTLRYMSPEQAAGNRVVVDPRSDVYSLGATLYELVSMQPAFTGHDRQEILHRIALYEPLRPRSLDRAIPQPLETIVLKAMAKDPANRYQSAEDLAEDLERFLDHRPIQAQPPTVAQRVASWSRRHRSFVLTGAAALVVAVICLVIFSAVLLKERNKLELEQNRSVANLELAEANLDTAIEVLDNLFLPLVQDRRTRRKPTAADIELLKNGKAFYRQLAQQNQNLSDKAKVRRAVALRRIGQIQLASEEAEMAIESFANSYDQLLDLYTNAPPSLETSLELNETRFRWISGYNAIGEYAKSMEIAKQGIESLKRWPESSLATMGRAKLQSSLSNCLEELGRFPEALQAIRQAEKLARKVIDSPDTSDEDHHFFIGLLMGLSDLEGVKQEYDPIPILEEALIHADRLLPEDADYSRMFVSRGIGVKLMARGQRLDEAELRLKDARTIARTLIEQEPGIPDHRSMRSQLCTDLANLAWKKGDMNRAAIEFRKASEFSVELAEEFPDSHEYQIEAGQKLREWASFAGGAQIHGMPDQRSQLIDGEETVQILERSIDFFKTAVALHDGPGPRVDLAMTMTNQAIFYGEILGDQKKAALRLARAVRPGLRCPGPNSPVRQCLAQRAFRPWRGLRLHPGSRVRVPAPPGPRARLPCALPRYG